MFYHNVKLIISITYTEKVKETSNPLPNLWSCLRVSQKLFTLYYMVTNPPINSVCLHREIHNYLFWHEFSFVHSVTVKLKKYFPEKKTVYWLSIFDKKNWHQVHQPLVIKIRVHMINYFKTTFVDLEFENDTPNDHFSKFILNLI